MTNVQWMDPVCRVHRLTPIETEAGRPPRRMEHQAWLPARRTELKPSMVPRLPKKAPRIHGNDHQMVNQGDCRE